MKVSKFILIAFLLFPLLSSADFSLDKWKYYKDVDVKVNGLVRLQLDDNLYANTKKNLGDIRVIDSSFGEVPFKLLIGNSKQSVDKYSPKLINNSHIKGEKSSVIADFGADGKIVNNIKIITLAENFQRTVNVSGSNDIENWSVLSENQYVYDYTDSRGKFKSQKTDVSFGDTTFRYIKVEISDEESDPVVIRNIAASRIVKEKAKEVRRIPQYSVNEKSETNETEIEIDMGVGGIPLTKALLTVSDKNFNRGIRIYSKGDDDEWKYVGQGYIYRYSTPKFSSENLAINFTEITDRLIKITISNKDDRPLEISGLNTFSTFRELSFNAKSNESYRIYYGNNKARSAQYDLEKYWKYLDQDQSTQVSISSQKENESYIPEKEPVKPLTERIPYLFSTIIVFSSLFLIVLVYRFMKE